MFNTAPWFYRDLFFENKVIETPLFFKINTINNQNLLEAVVNLKQYLIPDWLSKSKIYNNCDGTGSSPYKNIAVYKAISEALERWAFYELVESHEYKKFSFDSNPTSTGIAAYPSFFSKQARENAILEAIERWAIHEFWRENLPIIEHHTHNPNLSHFEIITPHQFHTSLLMYKVESHYVYSFATEATLGESLNHACIELSRNERVLKNILTSNLDYNLFQDVSDKRLVFFSTPLGNELFRKKITLAPKCIKSSPKVICDRELLGPWTQYTKVWRYLFDNSYHSDQLDHTFFMF